MVLVVMVMLALVVVGWRPAPGRLLAWRRPRAGDEVRLASTIAAELRAGRSLRQALEEAVAAAGFARNGIVLRSLASGMPLGTAVARLGPMLPRSGPAVTAAVEMAASSGGAVAPVFDRIAEHLTSMLQIDRERRAATAQIRLSAIVVGALPLGVTLLLFATGRFAAVLDGGSFGLAVMVAGALLQALGLAVIGVLVRLSR